jgi:transcriptional regulator
MYLPNAFAQTDRSTLYQFIREHGFAILASRRAEGLEANHLPLLLDAETPDAPYLFGHMARANDQWKRAEGEVLAIFHGPHAYISPSWYETEGTVPTWNYLAVHAWGTLRAIEDRDGLLEILRRSVHAFEGPRPKPWTFDESDLRIGAMLKSIVGFRIEITRLEGKWKLNQNHPEERRRRVVERLGVQSDPDSRAIVALMKDDLPKT